MSDQSLEQAGTDTADNSQAQAEKTYTQAEFDKHMAGLKASIQKKYEKTFAELGDIEELRNLKADAEKRQQEQQVKRGEFEKVLQELAAKKDQEIQKRDSVIKEYKVNTPLLSAAAQFKAVNAEQVKSLLANQVRLNNDGEVEVIGNDGSVRYNDAGAPLGVQDLVREFLDSNPHFVQSSPATTNTKSNVAGSTPSKLDISKLDMKNPEHRKMYAEYRKLNGLA
jgi:hypothetical protein